MSVDRRRQPSVTVCRGCCCGTDKHMDVDQQGQLDRLRSDIDGHARLVRSDCLDVCERSNVVVVNPSSFARSKGARPVWLGSVLEDEQFTEVASWICAGGPGVEKLPRGLARHRITPAQSKT